MQGLEIKKKKPKRWSKIGWVKSQCQLRRLSFVLGPKKVHAIT